MPRDARLGFVVGVTLVILIAVVCYHGDGKAGIPGSVGSSATMPAATTPIATSPGSRLGRTHQVRDGETLVSLAVRYYGDASKAALLFRANRDQLRSPDQVPLGAVLVVPEL